MHSRNQRTTASVVAPLAGTVVPLDQVPDPVFSGAVVGPGLAIRPTEPAGPADEDRRVVVVAPCDGWLATVYPHAAMIRLDPDRVVLVHVGLGTGQLAGAGFDLAARQGERVRAGQPLLAWSPALVRAGGRSTLCPVVALQGAR